ncbi:dTDP-4-dehydrorhamnose reductase [Pontibacillus salicampi]|uniref:dTDP-4-dehydrorhamnose reductase n=1 Tax=Pontibacillus salicampi TaxID=1449801 RepID=UPI00366D6524
MIIVVTGANGQLGKRLVNQLKQKHTVVGLGKEELNVTNKDEIDYQLAAIKPELIIHAAAYTAVDLCEVNRVLAFDVNSLGAGYVAQAAQSIGARMIYISSDYVFDGYKGVPYVEEDIPRPLSIYGLSKKLGEQLTMMSGNFMVVRTSWLYGHGGKNFVTTMLRLARAQQPISVVHDQFGSPTYINDLVDAIEYMLAAPCGVYHVTNSGSCSWYEFAEHIWREAGYNPEMITPISTSEYGAKAVRPAYSVLATSKLVQTGLSELRQWDQALTDFVRKEQSL